MRRQQFIQGREHLVKKIFLTSTTLWLVFSLMLLTTVSPSQAEIYRWKDDKGVVRYSNAAPTDKETELLDVIPTRRVPIVEDADGTVYYLNLPDGGLTQGMSFQDVLDQLSLPDEVLDELMEEAAAKTEEINAEPLSTVTFRLTELEEALEREITKRLEWEQEYLKSQSRSKNLEQRNEQLQLALVDMETKIGKVQKAVALSEIHASALREPQQQMGQLKNQLEELQTALLNQNPDKELGQLEGKIVQLQAYLTEMSRQSEEEVAEVSSTLDSVQEAQGLQLASLNGRLDELELGVNSFQQETFSEKFTALSREMQALKASLPENYDDSQLQTRLRELQSDLTEMSQQSEKEVAEVSSTLDSVQEAQSLQLASLNGRLNELEIGVGSFQPQAFSEKFTALSREMQDLKSSLPEGYDDSQLQARLRELQNTQKQQIGDLATKLQELETIKLTYEESIQVLSDKLWTLESSMDDLDRSAMMAKVDALVERVAAFEQQPQDETIHVKLAALETAMSTLTDAVPVSRNTSTLVAELLESKGHLEAMSGEQATQIRQQQIQLAMLRDELEQLKIRNNTPQAVKQEAPDVDPSILTTLAEKNARMENVIQQQVGALTLQQERIVAIESKLEQALVKSDIPQAAPVRLEEQQQKAQTTSRGRISVVERQYRRDATRPSKLGVYVTK